MAAENAGTITAELRLALDAMQKDALQAQKMMDHYARQFAKQGEEGGKLYVKGFGKSQVDLNKRLNEMVSSFRGVSPKMGAFGEKLAGVFSKPIFTMVPAVQTAFQAMLPVIGTVIAVVGVLIKGIQKAVEAHNEKVAAMRLAKEASDGLKTSVFDLANANVEVSDTMKELSRRAAEVTGYNNLAGAQREAAKSSKELANELINVSDAERYTRAGIMGGSTEPLMEDIKARKELLAVIKELDAEKKRAGDDYRHQLGAIRAAEKAGAKTTIEARKAEQSAVESQLDTLIELRITYESLGNNKEAAANVKELDLLIAGLVSEKDGLKSIIDELERLEELEEVLSVTGYDAFVDYFTQLRSSDVAKELGVINNIQNLQEKIAITQGRLNVLAQAYQAAKLANKRAEMRDAEADIAYAKITLAALQEELQREQAALAEQQNAQAFQAKLDAAKLNIEKNYNAAVQEANEEKRLGLIDNIELTKRLEDAEVARFEAYKDLVAQEGLTQGDTVDRMNRYYDQTVEGILRERKEKENSRKINDLILSQEESLEQQAIKGIRAKADSAKTEKERTELLAEAVIRENELMKAQRQRAWEAIEQSDEYIAADGTKQKEIRNNFDEITAGMMGRMKEMAEKGKKISIFETEGWQTGMQVATAALDVFDSISNAALEISRKHAEEQIAIIEEALNSTLKNIEEAREAELIAAGFAVEGNIASLEEQLEAAKRTGDEALIYQLERRQKEKEINDEYDKQAKEAEDKAAQEKADIEYKLAVGEHQMQMIQGANAGFMAVLQALSSAPPPVNYILAAAAGTAAGIQLDLLARNPPKPPQFASGGIVPGNSYSGDKVSAMVNSGELILNQEQQKRLFDIANSERTTGGGGVIQITMVLDGRAIAKSTVDNINNRQYLINAGSVV